MAGDGELPRGQTMVKAWAATKRNNCYASSSSSSASLYILVLLSTRFEFIPWFFMLCHGVASMMASNRWSGLQKYTRIHPTYLCGTLKLILNEIHKILPFNRVWLENVCVCLSRRAWHLCVLIGRLDRREVIFVYIYANIIWMMFGRWTPPARPEQIGWISHLFRFPGNSIHHLFCI